MPVYFSIQENQWFAEGKDSEFETCGPKMADFGIVPKFSLREINGLGSKMCGVLRTPHTLTGCNLT